MTSQHINSSIKLRHLMTSSSFIDMTLSPHLSEHTHSSACGHSCGHDHDDVEHIKNEDQDGAIGE